MTRPSIAGLVLFFVSVICQVVAASEDGQAEMINKTPSDYTQSNSINLSQEKKKYTFYMSLANPKTRENRINVIDTDFLQSIEQGAIYVEYLQRKFIQQSGQTQGL